MEIRKNATGERLRENTRLRRPGRSSFRRFRKCNLLGFRWKEDCVFVWEITSGV